MAHLEGTRGVDGGVSASTFKWLQTPAAGTDHALGWEPGKRQWANGDVLVHSGSNQMWYAVAWLAPERDLALIASPVSKRQQAYIESYRPCCSGSMRLKK